MELNNTTIHAFRAQDVDPVMDVWRKANAVAHPFLAPEFVTEVETAIRDIFVPRAETHVIEDARGITGFIAMMENEIGGLFVDPALHGQGHGRALVDFAVSRKGPLKVEVFRENQIGRRFYDRYGFVLTGEYLHEPSGKVCLKLAMNGA